MSRDDVYLRSVKERLAKIGETIEVNPGGARLGFIVHRADGRTTECFHSFADVERRLEKAGYPFPGFRNLPRR